MKKRLIGVAGPVIMLMAASGVHAGQGCSSITDYSNVWAVSGSSDSLDALDALDANEVKMPWRLSMDYSYVNANQLIRAGHREAALEPSWPLPALGVRNRYQKAVFGASYDFSSRLMAGVSIPYIYNHRWEDHNPSLHTGIGIGDITVYGRYWIKQEKNAFNYYVEGAIGLPTGKSNETYTFFDVQGTKKWVTKPRAAYIEPGLGQYVPTLATGFETKFMENNSLFGRIQYSDPLGKNDAGYRSQSTLMTNIGASRTFMLGDKSLFGVSGQFNHIFARFRRDSRDSATRIDAPVNNTGGTWLDFQPGAFYSPDGKLMFTVSVPISLHYHVNSLQTFAPYSLNLGVSQRF